MTDETSTLRGGNLLPLDGDSAPADVIFSPQTGHLKLPFFADCCRTLESNSTWQLAHFTVTIFSFYKTRITDDFALKSVTKQFPCQEKTGQCLRLKNSEIWQEVKHIDAAASMEPGPDSRSIFLLSFRNRVILSNEAPP
jgi:hypothetical protein